MGERERERASTKIICFNEIIGMREIEREVRQYVRMFVRVIDNNRE